MYFKKLMNVSSDYANVLFKMKQSSLDESNKDFNVVEYIDQSNTKTQEIVFPLKFESKYEMNYYPKNWQVSADAYDTFDQMININNDKIGKIHTTDQSLLRHFPEFD